MCKAVEEYANERKIEGMIEGRIEGKREGRIEGKLETIENMVNSGFELETALRLVNLDKETYTKHVKHRQ